MYPVRMCACVEDIQNTRDEHPSLIKTILHTAAGGENFFGKPGARGDGQTTNTKRISCFSTRNARAVGLRSGGGHDCRRVRGVRLRARR